MLRPRAQTAPDSSHSGLGSNGLPRELPAWAQPQVVTNSPREVIPRVVAPREVAPREVDSSHSTLGNNSLPWELPAWAQPQVVTTSPKEVIPRVVAPREVAPREFVLRERDSSHSPPLGNNSLPRELP